MTVSTPFTHESTAAEVIEGVDLSGKRAVVTGGASGIGFETSLALASAGAEVTLAVRNVQSGEEAADRIRAAVPGAIVHVARLDLSDLANVAEFARSWTGALHILVNNAGVMALPELTLDDNGYEAQFATNHLGHAALMLGLHPALARAGGARVVGVSSSAHLVSPVDFDDTHFASRAYDPWVAYGQSKTAEILFAVAAAKRWSDDGITVNTLHPGTIMTNLQRHLDDAALTWVGAKDDEGNTLEVPPGWKTPQQGAATTVLLAASPLVDGVTGAYFEDAQVAAITHDPQVGGSGLAAWAVDPGFSDRTWIESIRHVKEHAGS